jgi:hypothetical protein
MKQLIASRTLAIPDGVSIEVKARKVRVKGPRGEWCCSPVPLVGVCCRCKAGLSSMPPQLTAVRLQYTTLVSQLEASAEPACSSSSIVCVTCFPDEP